MRDVATRGPRIVPAARRFAGALQIRAIPGTTRAALSVLVAVQSLTFFVLAQPSFFFHDDYNYFQLAQERGFLHYLVSPILGVYPAPGDRLASFLLQWLAPLNHTVARLFLIVILAATTVALWSFVRTLARSDRWWTVALVVPFALSITLVLPMSYWSAGLPIVPALFFTVVALASWVRSYDDPRPRWWIGVAVVAVAAAGAFYLKFLLIPIYLLLFRVLILPRLMDLPAGIRGLWRERMRWIALAVPPALFLAVYLGSGLAARSAAEGSRPFVDYVATAWFEAFVPAAFLNARPAGSMIVSLLIVGGQLSFWGMVLITCRRSSLAPRGWVLFVLVFLLNVAMVGGVRLATFGVDVLARTLRYYPEVVLFLPITLALGLRQGSERQPGARWERSRGGQLAMAAITVVYLAGLLAFGPGMVGDSAGVRARSWYENLRGDVEALTVDGVPPTILDSETPEYVYEYWREPENRVSTILGLLPLDVTFNDLDGPIFLVRGDGHLVEATFRPLRSVVSGGSLADDAQVVGEGRTGSDAVCVLGGAELRYQPEEEVTGQDLAMRVMYRGASEGELALIVDAPDPGRPFRYLALRPDVSDAELVDLAASRFRAITIRPSSGDEACIERLEIGVVAPVRG